MSFARYMSEEELYAAALEREPDADAVRRMELRLEAGKNARQNVAFFDVTFSVAKSITLLHTAFEAQQVAAQRAGDTERAAAWGEFRQAVEDAIWAGNNAGLAYLNPHAGYSRVGRHGGSAGRWIDAPDWVVASFFQHDSREHDPQLHIHNAFAQPRAVQRREVAHRGLPGVAQGAAGCGGGRRADHHRAAHPHPRGDGGDPLRRARDDGGEFALGRLRDQWRVEEASTAAVADQSDPYEVGHAVPSAALS
jgi:TrwC relaxase